ncbi:MAG TPA: hypothetical protein VJG32_17865 [Anaerolineae bacterium]|nr:hypothetical protein [Anaerolineae bacterium]
MQPVCEWSEFPTRVLTTSHLRSYNHPLMIGHAAPPNTALDDYEFWKNYLETVIAEIRALQKQAKLIEKRLASKLASVPPEKPKP